MPLTEHFKKLLFFVFFFFSILVFFHEHSQFTGQQGKGEGIYLTPLYHFHPLHRHLDISRAITAESSPLHIADSQTRTGYCFVAEMTFIVVRYLGCISYMCKRLSRVLGQCFLTRNRSLSQVQVFHLSNQVLQGIQLFP